MTPQSNTSAIHSQDSSSAGGEVATSPRLDATCKEVTPMQESILRFIADYYGEVGVPPTVRQIGAHVGLSSSSTVHFHLKRLVDAGRLRSLGSRGFLLVEPA